MNENSLPQLEVEQPPKFKITNPEQAKTIKGFMREICEYIALFGYEVNEDDEFKLISDDIYDQLSAYLDSTDLDADTLPDITLAPRKIREKDEAYLAAGYDEGVFVTYNVAGWELQMNIVGGLRVVRSVDLKDNFSAAMNGRSQADRTDRQINQATDINLELFDDRHQRLFRVWFKFLARGKKSNLVLTTTNYRLKDGSEFELERQLRITGQVANNYAPQLKQRTAKIVGIKNDLIEQNQAVNS